MKSILYSALLCLLIISCRKQVSDLISSTPSLAPASGNDSFSIGQQYLKNVQSYLKGKMSDSAYQMLNWEKILLSKEESSWYLRIGYRTKSMAERFLLLTSDSSGHVSGARDVRLMRDPLVNDVFNGSMEIMDLRGNFVSSSVLTNGYVSSDRIRQPGVQEFNSVKDFYLVPAQPVQELPAVVVVGYYDGAGARPGITLGDYIDLSALSGGASGSSGAGIGYSGGSGGSSGSAANSGTISGVYSPLRPLAPVSNPATRAMSNHPTVINIESSYSKPGINLAYYLKCFSMVPDAGASYMVRLFVDLPVNDDPTQIFNPASGAVGHCFLGLTKTGSGQSVTQYIGFASTQPFTAILGTVTPGKIVDNGGHKYNATYNMSVTPAQFSLAMNSLSKLSGSAYDLNRFNCIDFSLSVINSFRPTTPIIPAVVQMPDGGLSVDTPQGLYLALKRIQDAHGAAASGGIWNAGSSHGTCN